MVAPASLRGSRDATFRDVAITLSPRLRTSRARSLPKPLEDAYDGPHQSIGQSNNPSRRTVINHTRDSATVDVLIVPQTMMLIESDCMNAVGKLIGSRPVDGPISRLD